MASKWGTRTSKVESGELNFGILGKGTSAPGRVKLD